MQRKFYDPDRNLEIEDTTGQKTTDQIIAKYGAGNWQHVDYDPKVQGVNFSNGTLSVINK